MQGLKTNLSEGLRASILKTMLFEIHWSEVRIIGLSKACILMLIVTGYGAGLIDN